MIYLFDGSNGASIIYDASSLTEEEKAKAVVVESLPIPDVIEGKIAILHANKATGEVYYEYIDNLPVIEVTEDEIKKLEENQLMLMDAIATLYEDLIIGGV